MTTPARTPAERTTAIVYRGLNVAKYLCWELRDEMLAIAPLYAAAWRYEDRPYALARVLERYRRRSTARNRLRRPYQRDRAGGLSARSHVAVLRRCRGGSPVIAGLAIVAVFAACAALMIARVLPALLAVPLLAILMGVSPERRASGLATIVTDGSVALAAVYATVIFGALLGRVTMETGIAEDDRQLRGRIRWRPPDACWRSSCARRSRCLFTSLTGLGAIIMIGTIVLPIMMTIGVPRTTAATLFLLAFALGFIFNIAQWTFYRKIFGVEQGAMQGFVGVALRDRSALAIVVFAVVRARVTRDYATWAVAAEERTRAKVPVWSLLTPVLPLGLYVFAHANALVAFALSALYGVLVTQPRRSVEIARRIRDSGRRGRRAGRDLDDGYRNAARGSQDCPPFKRRSRR